MTRLIIVCGAIILLQGILMLVRWRTHNLDLKRKRIIASVVSAIALVLTIVSRIPVIQERLGLFLAVHILIPYGFRTPFYLLDFFMLTFYVRMLIEHFILRLTYTKRQWIASAFFGVMLLVLTLQFWI